MDKETLSNYGWIVICVLVLAVMIALASPFGRFVAGAVKSTTAGLFGVNQNALGAAGIVIGDQEFQCDHEYEGGRCTICGAVDPNHTHTYPATGLTAKCEICGEIKEHTCTYDSNNICTICGEVKAIAYAFVASDYDAKMGTTTKTDAEVVIPETFVYNGTYYKTTSIGSGAFTNCTSLTNISIPDSVTKIDVQAFYGCEALANITIPNGVRTIGYEAFYGCKALANVTIPDSVTTIYYRAFMNCTSLTSITIPCNVSKIWEGAFNNCRSLTNVTIPGRVTSIGDGAFKNCVSLTSITIPQGVQMIDVEAFYNCRSITNITIPERITSIENRAFYGCRTLTSITFEGTVNQWNALTFGDDWNANVPATEVICSDGQVSLS